MASNIYAVIMAGGAGTRFWPASRNHRPKQLLHLAGGGSSASNASSAANAAHANESLLAATVRRLAPLITPDRVYIATGAHLIEATAAAVPDVPRAQILAEPVPRNTAPCIGWAAATIARRDPEALIAVLPSDHFIVDEPAFRATLACALDGARRGHISTIGIVPTRPETGYGYIEIGGDLGPGLSSVVRFVEKPNRARAEEYVNGKKHLWNAGMFFFRASAMRKAIEAHLPALAEGLDRLDLAAKEGREVAALAEVFPNLPSISIDHGVMEKASDLAVTHGDFGWNDVGSWESAWELATKDAEGNALPEGAIAVDAHRNLVRDLRTDARGEKKVYALVGVNDLVLVETDDAFLVIPRERAQDVRTVVETLRSRGDKGRI
ncbi:mannose-1-phosphate guanylyltransferase [Pendulispora albinea]|uniref:NTP transferase domain-containing protein n=1 Tax=Pendulispora albinea TaxID=2741071 RepID=A0ABZ2M3T2_9BACT